MIRLNRRRSKRKEEADLTDDLPTSNDPTEVRDGPPDELVGTSGGPSQGSRNDGAVTTTATRSRGAAAYRVLVLVMLPALVMLLTLGVAYLKWVSTMQDETRTARIQSVQAATDSTIKILSYNPETVEHDLEAAKSRLTGSFRDSYTDLTHNVVIPGAKQKKISAIATVPAAASVSASPNRVVVMVFVNQTIVVGNDAPSNTASTVRVTMERRDNRWLISDFSPI